MRSHAMMLSFALLSLSTLVVAQTQTITVPNGPSTVETFTTNAQGLPTTSVIGSTPAAASPYLLDKNHDSAQPTASSSPKELTPRAIVGITVSMLVIGSILAGSLVFFYRRKQRRSRRRPARDIIPVSSPTYDKSFIPGPFLTDIQAKGLGFDATEQPTRRIEAKFLPIDYRTSSEAKKTDDADPHVPRILVTGDGDTSGRSITPSSSGHHRPHSLTGHTPSIQYSLDVKSSLNSRGSSPDTLGEGPSSAAPAAPVETEITHRMRDLLEQMEHNVTAPAAEPGIAMVQLQRRVEILQRENQELREDIAPPAYEGNGRF